MTLPKLYHTLAAFGLVVGVFLTLPGCGNDKPTADKKKDDKQDKKDNTNTTQNPNPTPNPGTTPNPNPNPDTHPRPPERVDLTTGVGKDATDFLTAVHDGTAKADKLSARFLKGIGLPVEFDEDKTRGYSPGAAENVLKWVGMSTGFGPAFHAKQIGEAALLRGGLVGKQGNYTLRMVRDGALWKADWLSASSVEVKGSAPLAAPDADALAREFAATAVFETICDKDAIGKEQRVALIATALTPELRHAWADPFQADKNRGYDYSSTKLSAKIAEIGENVESVSFTPQGDAFRAEVTKKGGAKAAYLIKLVKGTTPGLWLVESITPQ
jgi:hypothetical protein